jgi:hypothetical protein
MEKNNPIVYGHYYLPQSTVFGKVEIGRDNAVKLCNVNYPEFPDS